MSDIAPSPATDEPVAAQFHAIAAEQAMQQLGTQAKGLGEVEAQARLAQYGPNRLPQGQRRSAFTRLLLQFHNLLIYVLIAAAVLATLIGHVTDAGFNDVFGSEILADGLCFRR